MSIVDLQTKASAAKKAYKANKTDKTLKKAYKAIKDQLEAAEKEAEEKKKAEEEAKKAEEEAKKNNKRKAESSDDDDSDSDSDSDDAPAAKKVKIDVEALKATAEAAKKAYKANKTDKSLKVAYKAAKQAAEEAEAANGATAAVEEPKEEKMEEEPKEDLLASLKKKAPAAAAHSDKAPAAKLFVGNLSWDIDDDGIKEFFKECGEPTDIHWLKDRESQRFKGCGFIEFASVELAKLGYAKNGEELMGRPIKIDYATPRPNAGGAGGKKAGGKFQNKPVGEMPDGCTTAFAGNLSFDIDEDGMHEFAKECGDIKGIRWLTDRDSGDFKGCGFIEFFNSESVKKFVAKNGSDLLGRAIRLDYSAPRPPRD